MKNTLTFIVVFITMSISAQSYRFSISGKIVTKKDKKPIESATIHLEKAKDSSVISYTISNKEGAFSLEGKSFSKNVRLYISFIGLEPYKKELSLSKKDFSLGTISLQEENLLDEIVIKSRAPITVKKDTLEFNVKSFKTKRDANVEDLLKKLPGVEVNSQGKITVNGKPVNKILVNGKPFFGNDPTITTRNLTKDIIETVQITDTKSKSESFTGERGDTNNKTINLTIKKENNKGWFGRISGGIGTKKTYEGATMINRFNNNRRFSVLAGTNNTNSPGFSFGEIEKMYGGLSGAGNIASASIGGGLNNSGIVTSKTTGATYADEYGKVINVTANYFYSGSNSKNDSKNNREYTIPNRRYSTNSHSNSNSNNDNHNISLGIDINADPTLLINIAPNFTLNKRTSTSNNSSKSLDKNNVLTNSSNSNSNSEGANNNFRNKIEITKKLNSSGSFIKASIENSIDKSNTDDYNRSKIESLGINGYSIDRNQYSNVSNNVIGLETNITYRYPIISEKFFIDIGYNYQDREEQNKNSTYDFNPSANRFSNFNKQQSSNFTYKDITKNPEMGLEYQTLKWQLSFKAGYTSRDLSNNDKLRPNLTLSRTFNASNLNTSFSYQFDSQAILFSSYQLNNESPQLNQVQTFVDVSDPLNITTGNPNLSPTKTHNAYIVFSKFNWQKQSGISLNANMLISDNQIVSNTEILPDLTRKSTYTNINGGYNISLSGDYIKNIRLDSISNLNLKIGLRASKNRDISLLNSIKNITTITSLSPSLGIVYEIGEFLRIEPRYEIGISETTYNTDKQQNQNFTRHTLNVLTKTNFPKQLEWTNSVRYNFNPNIVGFNKSSWFWNSTLAYSVFKDKGTITFKAYDILNQNTNAQRTATANFIEDAESTVLQRYFMLGFSWKFNSLGKKGEINEWDENRF